MKINNKLFNITLFSFSLTLLSSFLINHHQKVELKPGDYIAEKNAYFAATIEDETGELYVYGVYSSDGETRYDAMEDRPVAGDEVVLYGMLKTYNDSPEMDRGYLQAMKKAEVIIDESNYTAKSVSVARNDEAGALVKLTGVSKSLTTS